MQQNISVCLNNDRIKISSFAALGGKTLKRPRSSFLVHVFLSTEHASRLCDAFPLTFPEFIEQDQVAPLRAACIGKEYEADISGSRNMRLTQVLLDHRSCYCAGADCAYFTLWLKMTEWFMGSRDLGLIRT